MLQRFFLLCFFLPLAGYLSGCASLTHNGRNQVVVVKSRPSGAEVYYKGKKVGVTPALVEVERGKKAQVEIKHPKYGDKTVKLKPQYRWGRSFAGNLILFGLAPVGWFVDLVTGSCWELDDPVGATLNAKGKIKAPPFERLAVAPPQSPDEFLTDEVARVMEKEARDRYPKAELVPYKQTLEKFVEWEYDFDSKPSWSYRTRMFRELGVDHIIESEVKSGRSARVEVEATVSSFASEKPREKFNVSLHPEEVPAYSERRWTKKLGGFFRWIPNTVTVDLAGSSPSLKVNGQDVQGKGTYEEGFMGDVFRYLGALGLSHMEKQSERDIWQYHFQFVPTATVGWTNINYPTMPLIGDEEFERIFVGVGYGPQFGLKSKYGHTYIQLVPALSYSEIKWKIPGESPSKGRTSITAITEIGYTYFFSDRFVGRFFIRRVNEDVELWKEAMEGAAGGLTTFEFEEIGYNYVGFSFGYHFSVARNPVKTFVQ